MTLKHLLLAVMTAALTLASPAFADQDGGKKKNQKAPTAEVVKEKEKKKQEEAKEDDEDEDDKKGKEKDKRVRYGKFNDQERAEITGYFRANPSARSQLPPGLAKKNKIPPGWQKKLAVGQRFPDDAWEQRVPLPREVEDKLPRLEKGEIRVRVDDRVVRVAEKTREVLDVIELAREVTRGSPPR